MAAGRARAGKEQEEGQGECSNKAPHPDSKILLSGRRRLSVLHVDSGRFLQCSGPGCQQDLGITADFHRVIEGPQVV